MSKGGGKSYCLTWAMLFGLGYGVGHGCGFMCRILSFKLSRIPGYGSKIDTRVGTQHTCLMQVKNFIFLIHYIF